MKFKILAIFALMAVASLTLVSAENTCPWDVNKDGNVDNLDKMFVSDRFNCAVGQGDSNCDASDVDGNGFVNPGDRGHISANIGTICKADRADENELSTQLSIITVSPVSPINYCPWDVNGDRFVTESDREMVSQYIGCSKNTGNLYCDASDVDGNGIINPGDRGPISANLGMHCDSTRSTTGDNTDSEESPVEPSVVPIVEPVAPVVVESKEFSSNTEITKLEEKSKPKVESEKKQNDKKSTVTKTVEKKQSESPVKLSKDKAIKLESKTAVKTSNKMLSIFSRLFKRN